MSEATLKKSLSTVELSIRTVKPRTQASDPRNDQASARVVVVTSI